MLAQRVSSIFLWQFFYRTSKLNHSLKLKQYYNSRFNLKNYIKSLKKYENIIQLTLFIFAYILYMFNTNC